MMIEIRYKGEIFAQMPVAPDAHSGLEITMPDGRLLHVGSDGTYFKQPITTEDQITVARV